MFSVWHASALISLLSLISATVLSKRIHEHIDQETFNEIHEAHTYAAAAYCEDNTRTSDVDHYLVCPHAACSELLDPIRFFSFEHAHPKTDVSFDHQGRMGATGLTALHIAKKRIIVAFSSSRQLQTEFAKAYFELREDDNICPGCAVYGGFSVYWEAISRQVLDSVDELTYKYPEYEIRVTGHSLGGAVATIAAAMLQRQGLDVTLYTFGSPRVGDKSFVHFASEIKKHYRVTHHADWVSKLPAYPKYMHMPGEYYISSVYKETVTREGVLYLPKQHDGNSSGGGNVGTTSTDYSLESHRWFFDDISACRSETMEVDSWIEGGTTNFSYLDPCVRGQPSCVIQPQVQLGRVN